MEHIHLIPIGARVSIHPKSEFKNQCGGKDGTIVRHKTDGFPYRVEWDNGYENSYENKDICWIGVNNRSAAQTLPQY